MTSDGRTRQETSPFTCRQFARDNTPTIGGAHTKAATGRCLETEPTALAAFLTALPSSPGSELKITPPMAAETKQQLNRRSNDERQQVRAGKKLNGEPQLEAPNDEQCDSNLSIGLIEATSSVSSLPQTRKAANQLDESNCFRRCCYLSQKQTTRTLASPQSWLQAATLISLLFLAGSTTTSAFKSIENQQEAPSIVSNELTVALNNNNNTTTNNPLATPAEQISTQSTSEQSPPVHKSSSTLGHFFAKLTSAFASTPTEATTFESTTLPSSSTTTTTTTTTTNSTDYEAEEGEENDPSARDDDNDAESCKGLSANEPAETKRPTDNERLVKLQTCLQGKIKRRLLGATRAGLELFDRLSLSGGCSASLLGLAASLSELKSFAFKFLDASAKIPSGVLFGLLSDFGDYDQCLSIRSNPQVAPSAEVEEGAYSGKYCLLSVKLNYHIQLAPNETVPEGIDADGLLWDELVRNYWTSNSSKGFQVAVCVPSRCNQDDLEQLYRLAADAYNFDGQVLSCQDNNDLRAQQTPDCLQLAIMCTFGGLIGLALVASLVERYHWRPPNHQQHQSVALRVLVCFSLSRNWKIFMRKQNAGHDLLLADTNEHHHHHHQLNGGQRRERQQEFVSSTQSSSDTTNTTETTPETTPSELLSNSSHHLSYCDLLLTSQPFVDANPDHKVNSAQCKVSSFSSDSLPARLNLLQEEEEEEETQDQKKTHTAGYEQQLTVKINQHQHRLATSFTRAPLRDQPLEDNNPLSHLSGLKLLLIIWVTIGYSFLYPSANNYQYYRSIMSMKVTKDSVWFATTNFTLAIDTLLYITGLVFVYKTGQLARLLPTRTHYVDQQVTTTTTDTIGLVVRSIVRKLLCFWPTYLTVIGIAVVVPLWSDGPMWPEMVSQRLGLACRKNWWANLLVVNNLFSQTNICLPSSWFVSVLVQLFFIGSIVILMVRKFSLQVGMSLLTLLVVTSSAVSFGAAYYLNLRAPVIRMDESFVMELDENIFTLYTNLVNNLGPFLVGMAGGFILLKWKEQQQQQQQQQQRRTKNKPKVEAKVHQSFAFVCELLLALLVGSIAVLVLSSVFHDNYSRLSSATYWALHRVGWSLVTGYIVHQCATGKWRLLYDLLSLSTFIPLSRLIFIAYLVYPIFIHLHSGLVRDGLHVSIYNMMNIYITRLAFTFALALLVHLLVELPCRSIEHIWLAGPSAGGASDSCLAAKLAHHPPLLAVATRDAKSEPSTGSVLIAGKRVDLGQLNNNNDNKSNA